MGKFGKKNVVSTNLNNYMIGIIGPAGFGKSTLMYQTCSKLYGDDGYMILDMGMEDGIKAITGAVYERVPHYGVLNEIVTDIVKNKATDYPNLKVVIIDTLDAYFEVMEDYVIKDWNAAHSQDNGFVKAKSINSVEGGFGRGMDRVIDTAKKVISRLNSVGVGVWWTAHIKEKDVVDTYTGTTYTQLTANMSKKYFDAVKNSTDVVACGYYDRAIEKIEVGDENPVTKKKKQRNAVTSEARKIKFRDDMLIADAKSRFANIVGEIPLNTDAFVKAITDAIKAAQSVNSSVQQVAKVAPANAVEAQVAPEKVVEEPTSFDLDAGVDMNEEEDVAPFEVEEAFDRAAAINNIRSEWPNLLKEVKARIVNLKGKDKELDDASDAVLQEILDIIESEKGYID